MHCSVALQKELDNASLIHDHIMLTELLYHAREQAQ